MASHYNSPYHQAYDENQLHRRSQHHHRDNLVISRERFQSGSSRNFDQAPSIHVVKSRDRLDGNGLDDCSERSFQLGLDPIERDWGDARSMSYRREGTSVHINSSDSISNLSSSRHSQNATYKRRSQNNECIDEDCCPVWRDCDTRSTASSSFCSSLSHPYNQSFLTRQSSTTSSLYKVNEFDSRPPAHGAVQSLRMAGGDSLASNRDLRFSSSGSIAGSVGTRRSAPERRTPIPREPSLYLPDSSHHGRRNFSFHNHQPHGTERRALPQAPCTMDLALQQHAQPRCSRGDVPKEVMVDIAPGVQAPLRGSKETYVAVSKDFYSNVSCFGCSLELCCIADVSYVVCPACKVVSPVEGETFEGKPIKRRGLGLGFTYESLFQMQVEITKERNYRT